MKKRRRAMMSEDVEPLILFNHANGEMVEPYSITTSKTIGGNEYVSAYTLQLGIMNANGGYVTWYFDITKYKQLTIRIYGGYYFKDLSSGSIYSIDNDGVSGDFNIRDSAGTTTATQYYLSKSGIYGEHIYDVSDIEGFVYLEVSNHYYERPVAIQHIILE